MRRHIENELLSYEALIEKFESIKSKKHFKFSETMRILRSLSAIMNSRDGDYLTKSIIMTRYAGQVMQLIIDSAISVNEKNLLQFISTISELDNFMGPKVYSMLCCYSGSLKKKLESLQYKIENLYNQDIRTLNQELNRTIRTAMKFLSNCGFHRPDKAPIKDAGLLSLLQETIANNLEHMSTNTIEYILYHCAVMGLSHEHDLFLAEVIAFWNTREAQPYTPSATKALLYFLKHQDQLPQCAELLDKNAIVESMHAINAGNYKAEDPTNKTEQRVKRCIQGALKSPVFNQRKTHILAEFAVCHWNADFAVLINELPLTLLVGVDGPHHFVTANGSDNLLRTPKDLFRHNMMVYCLQLNKEQAVFYRRLTLSEADQVKGVSNLITRDLHALINDANKLVAKKRRTLQMRAYLERTDKEPAAQPVVPPARLYYSHPVMFFTPQGPTLVMHPPVTYTYDYSK